MHQAGGGWTILFLIAGDRLSKKLPDARNRFGGFVEQLIRRGGEVEFPRTLFRGHGLIDNRVAKFHLKKQCIGSPRNFRAPPFDALRPESRLVKIQPATVRHAHRPHSVW